MYRKFAFAAALIAPLALAGNALADGLENCTTEPEAKWKTIEEVSKMAVDQGFEVTKAKKEGTCYEVYAKDKDGKLWELFFNPVDGVILDKEDKS